MSLFSQNTISSSRIKVGATNVHLRIFFDPHKQREIPAYIENYYRTNGLLLIYKDFIELFKKFMIPVIITALETDRYLLEISTHLRKIEVMVTLTDSKPLAATSPIAITAKHIPLMLSLNNLILNLTKDLPSKGRYNSAALRKVIEHELFHVYHNDSYIEDWSSCMSVVTENIDKAEKLMNLNPEQSLKYSDLTMGEINLLMFLYTLKSEGAAKFRMKEMMQKIIVQSKLVRNSSGKMIPLVVSNSAPDKIFRLEYEFGAYMCLIIALGRLKNSNQEQKVTIMVGNKSFPLSQLDECLRTQDIFTISKLPEEIFHEVLTYLPKINSDRFLEEYNRMCGILNISATRRIISWEEYCTYRENIRQVKKRIDEYLSSKGFQPE